MRGGVHSPTPPLPHFPTPPIPVARGRAGEVIVARGGGGKAVRNGAYSASAALCYDFLHLIAFLIPILPCGLPFFSLEAQFADCKFLTGWRCMHGSGSGVRPGWGRGGLFDG